MAMVMAMAMAGILCTPNSTRTSSSGDAP